MDGGEAGWVGEQSSIAVAVGSPWRLCGEWDQRDGWGRDRDVCVGKSARLL